MTNRNGIIFGNENAEHDDLLFDCKIYNSDYDINNHLIITGRWGTGKTAQLLIINEDLSKTLAAIDEDYSRVWYIQEDDLNFSELFKAFTNSTDIREFRKLLEKIWIAEILRRTIVILGYLDLYYGKIENDHWELIRNAFKQKSFSNTLWKQLPNIIKVISNKEKAEAAIDIQDELIKIFQEDLFKDVQKCLYDIKDNPIQPIITIEPLETPNSDLDKQVSLAQEVISSLVNVFERKFQPSDRQHLKVVLAIPWHRYKLAGFNLPQKISQYKYTMHWDYESLKSFINERICYEFKKVGRVKYDKKNAWYDLFEETISRTDHFEIPLKEDTFDYALRFTHHRPRDLQKLVRLALNNSVETSSRSANDILKGIGGIQIRSNHLRNAVHLFRREATQLLIEEFERGNPGFKELVLKLQGLPACQNYNSFIDKFISIGLTPEKDLLKLWDSGIIGVEVFSDKNQQNFYAILPDEAKKTDKDIQGNSVTRGYFFEYNTDMNIHEIIRRFKNGNAENKVNIVFHPKTFDTIIGQQYRKWPIGI